MDENLKKEIEEMLEKYKYQDSIEIGTAKNGGFKCYFNASDYETALKRIQNCIKLLKEAKKENGE